MSARSSIAVAARLDLGRLRIHQMDGLPGHDGRDRMLIYELRVTVPTQQHTKVVEPAHDPLELHAVDQKDCEWGLVLSHVVQERVLKVLDSVCTHGLLSPFLGLLWGTPAAFSNDPASCYIIAIISHCTTARYTSFPSQMKPFS